MQNKTLYSDKEEEIDLAALFRKLWSVFKKRVRLFFTLFIIGIALAILYYNFAPRTYKSRMIVSSTLFQGPSFVIILDNLQMLLKDGNHEALATILNIDIPTAEQIKKLEVYSSKNYAEQEFGDKVSFKDDKLLTQDDDKKEKKEDFVIEAFVADNDVFKKLEEGIIYYLNNNPSLKETSDLKKEAFNDLKNKIYKQRLQLDSLQKSIAQNLNNKGNSGNFFIGEPGAMYTDMIKLYEAELRANAELYASNISVIESFRIYKKQHSPKLGITLVMSVFLSGLLFIATVIYLESNEKE